MRLTDDVVGDVRRRRGRIVSDDEPHIVGMFGDVLAVVMESKRNGKALAE